MSGHRKFAPYSSARGLLADSSCWLQWDPDYQANEGHSQTRILKNQPYNAGEAPTPTWCCRSSLLLLIWGCWGCQRLLAATTAASAFMPHNAGCRRQHDSWLGPDICSAVYLQFLLLHEAGRRPQLTVPIQRAISCVRQRPGAEEPLHWAAVRAARYEGSRSFTQAA